MTAKEYLRRYRTAYRKAQDIRDDIQRMRERYASASGISYEDGDMPKAQNSRDLSDYIVILDSMQKDLEAQLARCAKIEMEIREAIRRIPDERQQMILRMRYLDCMKWEEIANLISLDVRHVYRLHGYALQNLVIKCHVLSML